MKPNEGMDAVALTLEVEAALETLTSRLSAAVMADELHMVVLENELSQGIEELLSKQHEFTTTRIVRALSGSTGFHPMSVAPLLLREAQRRQSSKAAVAWLQKVLSTEEAVGIAIETLWGFSPSESVMLHDDVQLVPFTSLPPSRQKDALSLSFSRPKLSIPSFALNEPTAALVRPVIIRPFFGRFEDDCILSDNAAAYRALFADARLCLSACGPAAIVPGPAWFQYIDPDLELAQMWQVTSFTHQEIMPLVLAEFGQVDTALAATLLRQLVGLSDEWKNKARIALQRLGLACLRQGPAERALELAIALEALLVDSQGEHAFKIALRAALLASTEIESRRRKRAIIKAMYEIRSSFVHSGRCSDTKKVGTYGNLQTAKIIDEALEITALVIRIAIAWVEAPDWSSLELSASV